jgi:predicted membrane channel-forming protein YqfA (hemolysin III family)
MPRVLSFNPHIHHGYRPAGSTPFACLCSVASLSNESFNIWSHLLPLMLALLALTCGLARPWPSAPGAWALAALPAAACLAGSVAYHTLMPAHARYGLWLALDLAGVFIFFTGGMVPLLHWGFACHVAARAAFTAAYYTCAVIAVVAALRASSPAARALPMAGLAAVRCASLAARGWLGAGAPGALAHFAAMEVLAIAGALINVARWPEKWVDAHRVRARETEEQEEEKEGLARGGGGGGGGGRAPEPGGGGGHGQKNTATTTARHPPPHLIDFAFNSHNLMHLAVLAAMVAYGRGAALEYEWAHGGWAAAGRAGLCAHVRGG